jgi:hypothetical protein
MASTFWLNKSYQRSNTKARGREMDGLKLEVTNQRQDEFRAMALSTPDFQQIEESLSKANNSNVDFPFLRVYKTQTLQK